MKAKDIIEADFTGEPGLRHSRYKKRLIDWSLKTEPIITADGYRSPSSVVYGKPFEWTINKATGTDDWYMDDIALVNFDETFMYIEPGETTPADVFNKLRAEKLI